MAKQRGLALEEHEKRKLNKQNLGKIKHIFMFILPYKSRFILVLVFLLFSSLTLLFFPFVAGKLIDAAQGKEWIVSDVNSISLILIGILAVQSIFSFFVLCTLVFLSKEFLKLLLIYFFYNFTIYINKVLYIY
jgi:ABC-type multidrug transport system fused ATPase/permease subunit